MVKPEWGTKRSCLECGAKFYDFSRTPITCPSCDTVLAVEAPQRSRKSRAKKPAPAPVEVAVAAAETPAETSAEAAETPAETPAEDATVTDNDDDDDIEDLLPDDADGDRIDGDDNLEGEMENVLPEADAAKDGEKIDT